MLKKIQLLSVSFLIFVFIFSACKKVDERENYYRGTEIPEIQESYSFTQEEFDILNQTLNIPIQLPRYSFSNAPHAVGASSPGAFIDPYAATLGRVLFYDKKLSIDSTISCASCHQQSLAFSDNKAFSEGVNDNHTERNSIGLGSFRSLLFVYYGSPSQFAPVQHHLFWDERESVIENQISAALRNPKEMGMASVSWIDRIKNRPEYEILFRKVGGGPITSEAQIVSAFSPFMSSLNSQGSLLDKSLNELGPSTTIEKDLYSFNDIQNLGRELFFNNCYNCHSHSISLRRGPLFTAANNGLDIEYIDKGKGAITYDVSDDGVFKIPSLRNVEVTGPYMHDGRFETLEEVIDFYSTGIQPHDNLHEHLKDVDGNPKEFNFTNEEKEALIEFLKTMTDEDFLTDPKFSDPFK